MRKRAKHALEATIREYDSTRERMILDLRDLSTWARKAADKLAEDPEAKPTVFETVNMQVYNEIQEKYINCRALSERIRVLKWMMEA